MYKFVLICTLACAPQLALANDIEVLRELIQAYTDSVGSLDMQAAERIWSTGADTSFIHPRGHQVGWEDIKQAFYLETMGRFKQRELKAHGISIRQMTPTTAWGDFYWNFEATLEDGSSITTAGRETQIWQKVGGQWKIVHVHYSGMPVTGEREGF